MSAMGTCTNCPHSDYVHEDWGFCADCSCPGFAWGEDAVGFPVNRGGDHIEEGAA